jgi:hypothetical protein
MTTPASDPASAAEALLVAHVPLTLLIDLLAPVVSSDIYAAEPGDADWLPSAAAS